MALLMTVDVSQNDFVLLLADDNWPRARYGVFSPGLQSAWAAAGR